MRNRCNNPTNTNYPSYGGRGIKVCKRWDDFTVFLADMGEKPEGKTLDRINNDGDYEPGNCRWATRSEQQKNKRKPKRGWWSEPGRENPRWKGHIAKQTKEMLATQRPRAQAKAEGWFKHKLAVTPHA
jgi:hypothetical protein